MGECMTFPATFEEFAESYKIVDKEQIYTNGTALIPIFRVKQWLDHLPTADVAEVKHGKWIMTVYTTVSPRGRYITNKKFSCSECKRDNGRYTMPYCPNCGAKMDGKEDT